MKMASEWMSHDIKVIGRDLVELATSTCGMIKPSALSTIGSQGNAKFVVCIQGS
jgi:hypothetical protein